MSRICCFTGHRDIRTSEYLKAITALENELARLVDEEGVTDFRAGGARGFDTMAALSVLKLKMTHPEIKLHLILPCKDQDKYFATAEKSIYKYILESADSVSYVRERYSNGVMAMRNRALVDGADVCLAFLSRLSGGTYQTVVMARRSGVQVINVYRKLI